MSRSKRKPYASITGQKSNKQDKRQTNRYFRRYNRNAILKGKELLFKVRECSDVWNYDSDGLDMYLPSMKWVDENYLQKVQRK